MGLGTVGLSLTKVGTTGRGGRHEVRCSLVAASDSGLGAVERRQSRRLARVFRARADCSARCRANPSSVGSITAPVV